MVFQDFLNPFVIYNFLVGLIYLWVFWRINTFLKLSVGQQITFAKYFGRAFGILSLYFLIAVPLIVIFAGLPFWLGVIHWLSDIFIYAAFLQLIISLSLLVVPHLFSRLKNLIYSLGIFLIFLTSYYHIFPEIRHEAQHTAFLSWAVIISMERPAWVNYLPFLLWMMGFLILGIFILLFSLRVGDKFARRRGLTLALAIFIFALSYPFSRFLFFLNLPILSPLFSFLAAIVGLYLLTSASCLAAIFSLLMRKPIQAKGR